MQGSQTFVLINSRLEGHNEERSEPLRDVPSHESNDKSFYHSCVVPSHESNDKSFYHSCVVKGGVHGQTS